MSGSSPPASPGLFSFLATGWEHMQNVYWLLTDEETQKSTQQDLQRAEEEMASIAQSPFQKAPSLSDEVTPTIKKINNIMNFLIPTCIYLGQFCFYGAAISYTWHFMTRLFTGVSLTFLISCLFSMTLCCDISTIGSAASELQRKFVLIIGDSTDASLKRDEPSVRLALTQSHIKDALHEVDKLSKSLYLIHFILRPAITQTHKHLENIDKKISPSEDD